MRISHRIEAGAHAKGDKLLNCYASLDAKEQALLLLLAVIYNPIGITKLIGVVKSLVDEGFLPGKSSHYELTSERRRYLIEQKILFSKNEGLLVDPLLANLLVKRLIAAEPKGLQQLNGLRFIHILRASEHAMPVLQNLQWRTALSDKSRVMRDFFLLGEMHNLVELMAPNKNPQIIDVEQNRVLVELCFLPYENESFLALPAQLQYQVFASLLKLCLKDGQSIAYPITVLEAFCQQSPEHELCHLLLAEYYLYQGRFDDFSALIQLAPLSLQRSSPQSSQETTYALQLKASYDLLQGRVEDARLKFEQALKAKNKIARRKRQYIGATLGLFHKLGLIVLSGNGQSANGEGANGQRSGGQGASIQKAADFAAYEYDDRNAPKDTLSALETMRVLLRSLINGKPFSERLTYMTKLEGLNVFDFQLCRLFILYGFAWCNESLDSEEKSYLDQQASNARQSFSKMGLYSFVALIEQIQKHFGFAAYVENAENSEQEQRKSGEALAPSDGTATPKVDINIHFPGQIRVKQKWEYALDKLIAMNPSGNAHTPIESLANASSEYRLIWELRMGRFEDSIVPREQKSTRTGWTKGRVVALKRLYENAGDFDYLSESDRQVCRAIQCLKGYGYYANDQYSLEGETALRAVAGIDNLYLENDLEQPIELSLKEPELIVTELSEQLCLTLSDSLEGLNFQDNDGFDKALEPIKNYKLTAVNKSQYHFVPFSQAHLQLMSVLGDEGLLVPISAKARALEGIAAIAPLLNIRSDLDAIDTGLETIEPDLTLYINIEPTNDGLSFTCVQMPFGPKGPICKPGAGSPSMSAKLDGKRKSVQRDLIHEQHLLDALDAACPAFLSMTDTVLRLDDYQLALEALEQLEQAIKEDKLNAVLRWPKGKRIHITKRLTPEKMQLAVVKENEWFDISGNIRLDDDEVIELRSLLNLLATSNGRFVELDSKRVLALSQDLKQRLEMLEQVTDEGRFHPLSAPQVEEATQSMRLKTIKAWDKQTALMHEANTLDIQLPKTFAGELRDYQYQGYDWAMRLSHWGAGACLADDMGLGKTLQALALLLAKAKRGPSLVLAPSSVCFNWQQEAVKFAPSLNIVMFSDSASTVQRSELLKDLSAYDCVLVSYGLLQREAELLSGLKWSVIVADEAQALKNPLAKRTKAAYGLKADFKMITTGTPIENNLSELWSLFRFVNPGLLGNLKQFHKRFIQPIANEKDDRLAAHAARNALKTLIKPFILRRLKSQVLTELPSRTEINIPVQLSDKEQAFYEAIRLNALEKIAQANSQATGTANQGEQRIRLLAELVKLRQACCNPKLVMEESDLPSAKLAALDALLDELSANNHRALIFSQFVEHLKLIKQHVEQRGMSYQYLDGSSPAIKRKKSVNDFQAGEGELFLISLKAGGFGLNLTGADYVIHMDPWWNPAVEDQASDRAHRMGQTRPVTIYRLVTQRTIEEKIVALHQQKRDLADSLLAGNEQAQNLSVDDILVLLKKML